jgi:hypothetical protein
MCILMLALIDTGRPQLLRKTGSKFRALRAHMPDTLCCVVGNFRDDMRDYAFTSRTVTERKDRLAAAAGLAA